MNYKLNITPTKEQLLEIKAWLSKELEETGEGSMHNWNIIEDYFDRNQLILLSYESQSIGFTTWELIDRIVLYIDLASIQPKFRFKGAGKFMIQETFEYLKSKGVVVAELFCQPRSSERFWKSIGFIDMPKTRFNQHELFLYYPLITQNPKSDFSENNMIELWNCEPHSAANKDAKWTWYFELSNNKLASPILAPCDRDWNIRWSKGGKVIKESKVKYFSRDQPIDRGSFMFIEELNHPT